jgi:lipoate-protein ligase A
MLRLLPDFQVADGPHNMAADEVLLEAAVAGTASLRFYAWSEPTVSLGYFQPRGALRAAPPLAGLPCVRRPSGGKALVHHHEITYALALPAGPDWQGGESWLPLVHRAVATALGWLGVTARLYQPPDVHPETPLCFLHLTAGDLLVNGAKVGGSAQRKHRGALMQHGALLLAQSPYTPGLPGLHELTGRELDVTDISAAVCRALLRQTGWALGSRGWTADEAARVEELVAQRYGLREWNEKR